MDRKQGVLAVVALVLMAASVALAVVFLQLGSEGAAPDPDAMFVCDRCGTEATLPLSNVSPDCPHCDQGQLVQRVFFRCKRCGAVFEAYQLCWSPDAERAAAKVKQADASFSGSECGGDARLVRRPNGPWLWAYCAGDHDPGSEVVNRLLCPECGEKRRGQFIKVLVPPLR